MTHFLLFLILCALVPGLLAFTIQTVAVISGLAIAGIVVALYAWWLYVDQANALGFTGFIVLVLAFVAGQIWLQKHIDRFWDGVHQRDRQRAATLHIK